MTLEPFEDRRSAAAKVNGLLAGVVRETADIAA